MRLTRRRPLAVSVEGAAPRAPAAALRYCRHACHSVLLPSRKQRQSTARASARPKTSTALGRRAGWELHGLKRRHGGPLQAYGRRHASRATPSRGLASRRLAEALASHKGRAAWPIGRWLCGARGAVVGLPGGRDPTPTFVTTTPANCGHSRTSTVSYREGEQPCPPSEPRSPNGRRPDF